MLKGISKGSQVPWMMVILILQVIGSDVMGQVWIDRGVAMEFFPMEIETRTVFHLDADAMHAT